jgi:hypothetical protein
VWAYRKFLGRTPKIPEIQFWMAHAATTDALVSGVVGSAEFSHRSTAIAAEKASRYFRRRRVARWRLVVLLFAIAALV